MEPRRETKTGARERGRDGNREERERARERERGHVGFGLLVLPSGQLADLFM